MANSRSPAPIIAAVLLLLPVLYVGSYLALKRPRTLVDPYWQPYRLGGAWAERVYWPLEQIDHRLHTGAWKKELLIPEGKPSPFVPASQVSCEAD